MKRLLLFAFVALAAWYGWKHQDLLRSHGDHEVVAVNRSGHAIERLRVMVGDQAFAIETLEDGSTQREPLRCDHDGPFRLEWQVRGEVGERNWSGGGFSHGPVLMRHRFEFTEGDGVIWSSERIATKGSSGR